MAKRRSSSSKFTDRICNIIPSQATELDWEFPDALAAGALAAASPPPKVDLRDNTWWKIGDQEQTGSCVGWATADGVMRYLLVKAGRLGKNELLSPRFVWMASKETDEFTTRPQTFIEEAGTSLKAAADVVRKYGTVTDSFLPFKISTLMHGGAENAFYAAASTRRAANYFNLKKNLQEWKNWLASTGPILAALNVDKTWYEAGSNGGKLDTYQPATMGGGHAVAIVGYTADRFIIRNSWGTGWGDKGFGYASVAYITNAFFAEAYGFTL